MDDTHEPGTNGEHQPGGGAAEEPVAGASPWSSGGEWNPPPPASPSPPWEPRPGAGSDAPGGWTPGGWGGPGGGPQSGLWGGTPRGWTPPSGPGSPGGGSAGGGAPGGWGAAPGGWGGDWAGGPAGPHSPSGWATPWGRPGPSRPRQTLPGAVIALLLVVAVLVGLGIGHGVWKSTANPSPAGSGSALAPSGVGNSGNSGQGGSIDPASVAAKVSPALVDINTSLSYQHDQAAGTGIVLTSDGVVLTNNHVISGATSISATDVGNGKTYPADVVGYDRTHDIAVIKLRGASDLQKAEIGNSDKVSIGDGVVGLGNAGGVGGPPSSAEGTVTGLNRSITASDEGNGTTEQLMGLIETNANIQPGDSGGALVNSSGQVVGMDTAASAGFSFQTQGNQGFAIPINQAMSIAGQIRSGQESSTVHIGPTAFLGVLVDTRASSQGATLSGVVPSGPAAQAGLQSGDTIVSLGGKNVDSPNTLTALVGQYHPGQSVAIGWLDASGQNHQASITLANGPAA